MTCTGFQPRPSQSLCYAHFNSFYSWINISDSFFYYCTKLKHVQGYLPQSSQSWKILTWRDTKHERGPISVNNPTWNKYSDENLSLIRSGPFTIIQPITRRDQKERMMVKGQIVAINHLIMAKLYRKILFLQREGKKWVTGQKRFQWRHWTLYTLTWVKLFSILFPIHSLRCWLGEFV